MREPRQPDNHDQLIAFKCPVCGIAANVRANVVRVNCPCGFTQEGATLGLGDMVAAGLQKIGITKVRYTDAKAAVGLKKTCNCGRRQRKINELGRKIGIG